MKKILYLILILSFILILISFLALSIRSNTLVTSTQKRVIFSSLSPQGWGFFTRSPRDPMVDIYKINSGELEKVSGKNMSFSNILGFSRRGRKIGMEISTVLSKIKTEKWNLIDSPGKLEIPTKTSQITSATLYYLSKGEYLLVKTQLVPWAWYGRKNNFIPYETIRIQIK